VWNAVDTCRPKVLILGSSPNELAMIEGFKESRVRGFKGKSLKLKSEEEFFLKN
jgi:hypothetical protein